MPAVTENTVPCINPICAKPLVVGARFCPYCAMAQTPAEEGNTQTAEQEEELHFAPPPRQPRQKVPPASNALVLRASEKVWHMEEDEGTPAPGKKRPLLVLDEQTTHLAHTDRQLAPEELLERVKALLTRDQVPIDVALKPTLWMSDTEEARPRLIASLRGHRYSDIKMLLGVDYLGRWASIHLSLATEPEPVTAPPKFDEQPFDAPAVTPVGAIILIALGVLGLLISSSAGTAFGVLGVISIIGGFIWLNRRLNEQAAVRRERKAAWEDAQRERRRAWDQEQQRNAQARATERVSRTFKVDDMRLFSTAMRQVFQTVVDDIVSQGGEVARIEGGQGGFFQSQGVTQAVPPSQRTDAAQTGV